MKALKITGAIIAFLLGGMCITGTIIDLYSGKYDLTHPEFFGGIVFHALMGYPGHIPSDKSNSLQTKNRNCCRRRITIPGR